MDIMKRWGLCLVLFALAPWGLAQQDLVLTGDVKGAQHKTYFDVPFTVPAGVHRISVDFHYTARDQRATLDLGIADPHRFRGESGGNKSHFTIGETDATPSYLPGEIPAGEWRLIIAVPNMRPQVVSHYTAEIHFNSRAEDAAFAVQPLAKGTRWYRGDLHMHTGHSDGSCKSQSGQKVPCPLFLTVQAAAARGLDFIAITDHNTDSHYADERELQPYFDHLLLIPGREMTTFHGHFNVFRCDAIHRLAGGSQQHAARRTCQGRHRLDQPCRSSGRRRMHGLPLDAACGRGHGAVQRRWK